MDANATRIAIVGMACRYPDANDPDELWQTVLGTRRAFRSIPECRLSSAYLGPPDDPDRTYVTHAGLLRDWQFDRPQFGVPGPLYRAADQTHWLALQVAAEALADAGFPDGVGLDRDQVGVVLGNSLTGEFTRANQLRLRWPFVQRAASAAVEASGVDDLTAAKVLEELERFIKQPFPVPGDESLAGALANTIAGRICNQFDFHGTGYTVDGACASSLLAVMTASRALVTGELDFALAGGVDLSLDPFELVGFARLGALAVDHMRVYDANPTGFLPGEGCGVVALMRADDAERAGVRSYAELIGWGTSSDGAGGLTRPEVSGQTRALTRAYRMSGVGPDSVGLVEGHGTGTAVGDATELTVLRTVFADRQLPAALGSIKANIGHTKAAAGVAGLIKATLAVHHRVLPPTTGCAQPHALLRGADSPVRIQTEAEPWSAPVPMAAVSAMGFGGINTHVVLRGERNEPTFSLPPTVRTWSRPRAADEIVFCGADTLSELEAGLDRIIDRAGSLSAAELHDLAATSGRATATVAAVRCALVARTPGELVTMAAKARKRLVDGDLTLVVDEAGFALGKGGRGKVGLLFPGQAAPVRAALAAWPPVKVPQLPPGVRVTDGDTDTAVAQPAIVRQSLAGLAWLASLECRPVGAAGHSLGEITALVWAGALTPEEGLRLAARRGALMAQHGVQGTTMASVGAEHTAVAGLLAGTAATIAGINSRRQTTIAGPQPDVAEVVRRARQERLPATLLPVSHGFHSSAMLPVVDPLGAALADFNFREPTRPVFSTVTGELLDPAADVAELLVGQLVRPVRFLDAVRNLAQRCDLLLEVGPGTALSGLARESVVIVPVVSMDCGGDPRRTALATAALVAAGSAQLGPWFGNGGHRVVDLDRPVDFLANPCETAPDGSVPTGNVTHAGNGTNGSNGIGLSKPRRVVAQGTNGGPPPRSAGQDSVTVLREHLSRTLELPQDSISTDSSPLSDLHLSSLQLVDVVATVAGLLGKEPPRQGQAMASASVRELAKMIAEQPQASSSTEPGARGVRDWVRAFEHRWVPYEDHRPQSGGIVWISDPPDGARSGSVPAPGGQADPTRYGMVVKLGDAVDHEAAVCEVANVLGRIAQVQPQALVVLQHGNPAAAALARSVAVEFPDCGVTVVDRPPWHEFPLAMAVESGYLELRVGEDGRYERSVTEPRARGHAAAVPLQPGDVCLVTGGTTGITARCASALARQSGAMLVVLGRSPADAPGVVAGMRELGEQARYIRCDVTDPADVRAAVSAAATRGPIRGLLHGAGLNDPRLIGEVSCATLRRTVWPKVDGLRRLLEAVGEQLRLVVGFGSIIGRTGLPGQSEYCIANDWMRHDLEAWAARSPDCRAHLLEWSLWSDVGMGERLGVVDRLHSQGVVPIQPDAGVAAMLAVLSDETAPVTVMLSGRFPAVATLPAAGTVNPLRFGEEELERTAGVETVLRADLSVGTDPYLDDHRVENIPTMPAVVGLEAMAQATERVVGSQRGWSFTDVLLPAPITVHERASRSIQIAALADEAGATVDVVVRADTDAYATERIAATVRSAPPAPPRVALPTPPTPGTEPHPFYGPLLFHRGRFQRLIRYDHLSAFEVRAWITARDGDRWFSEFHSQRLLLGDPGAHDATVHVLLACVPHRRALPVGADRITVWRQPKGPLLVHARERSHTADDYVFDVDVIAADGEPVSRWEGLRLHAIGPREWTQPLPLGLVGPLLSRRMIELGVGDRTELTTLPTQRAAGRHAPLIVATDPTLGLAAELAVASADPASATLSRLAADLAARLGEQPCMAESRVRCSAMALSGIHELGIRDVAEDGRLQVEEVTDDGLLFLRRADRLVVSARFTTELSDPLTVAVAVRGG
jgi:enediyne polyketide synthase